MATRLQELRKAKGLSQSKLAEAANVNIRTLQMYEEGHREIAHARIDVLLRLCTVLECKLEELISPRFGELYSEYNKK